VNSCVDHTARKVPAPIVLLTDFGSQDSYVGVMKGVIATICPRVRCIDLTHAIPPQQVRVGRFCLQQAYGYFPPGSIFLCVVDPGVGSQRRAIAVDCGQAIYVGPDNGLGTALWQQQAVHHCVALTNADYWWGGDVSRTFHGRDIFAPVAAHLANGIDIKQLGRPLDPASLVTLPTSPLTVTPEQITGSIDYIDRFGNLISNIPAALLSANDQVIYHNQIFPLGQTYNDYPPGHVFALIGSHGFLEIVMNGGNAQAQLQAQIGDRLGVVR
jgi:S-adenosylmethionine hydrolase